MGKYFVRGTPLAGLERMMMEVPNFAARSSGRALLCRYHPQAADLDCRNCLQYRRRGCRSLTCLYLTERLQTGAVTMEEMIAELVRPWKHLRLKQRAMTIACQAKAFYFEGQLHIARMLRMTQGEETVNSRWLAAVYLLSSHASLWQKTLAAVSPGQIAFDCVRLDNTTVQDYVLYRVAKGLYQDFCAAVRRHIRCCGGLAGEVHQCCDGLGTGGWLGTSIKTRNVLCYGFACVALEDQGYLFLCDWIIGAEQAVSVAIHQALTRGPADAFCIPLTVWHVRKLQRIVSFWTARLLPEYRYQHGTGQTALRLKSRAAYAVHQLMLPAVHNCFSIPRIGIHIGKADIIRAGSNQCTDRQRAVSTVFCVSARRTTASTDSTHQHDRQEKEY